MGTSWHLLDFFVLALVCVAGCLGGLVGLFSGGIIFGNILEIALGFIRINGWLLEGINDALVILIYLDNYKL